VYASWFLERCQVSYGACCVFCCRTLPLCTCTATAS